MTKELNSIILDHKSHAKELSDMLKANNVEFKLCHPKEDLSAYKFKFEEPLSKEMQNHINSLADKWYEEAMER